MSRATALLLALWSLAVAAQGEPVPPPLPPPPPPPPLVSPEPAPAAQSCTSSAECARGDVCIGFQELSPGKWSRGTCQPSAARRYQQQLNDNVPPTECTTTDECAQGFVCGDFRDMGNGKWSKGICLYIGETPVQAPPARASSATGRAQRFEYQGTVPPGFRLVSENRDDLLRAGAITFGVSYGVMIIVSVVSQVYAGMIPVIGPIFYMAETSRFSLNVFDVAFGVTQVAAQGIGLGLIIAGFTLKKQWLEREPGAPAGPQLMLLPSAAGAPLGASVVGRF